MSKPHLFVENRGQIHTPDGKLLSPILYHLSGGRVNVSLTAQGIHYSFFRKITAGTEPAAASAAKDRLPSAEKYETAGLDVQLLGANQAPRITAEEQQDYYENYYLAGCGKAGLTNVHSYAKIVYHDVYPHIDWMVYVPGSGGGKGVKYDFIVHPGGNPSDIKLKYPDASAVSLNSDGSLTASSELGALQEGKPYSYIREGGQEVPARYRLDGSVLSYAVQSQTGKTLVIDPQVVWATYYGGSAADFSYAAACDASGFGYVAGRTNSTSNIATLGSHKSTASATGDAYLAKFSRLGNLTWASYFGGNAQDFATAIALDQNSGSLYLCGYTESADSIATTGSHQMTLNGGSNIYRPDGFIAKFNSGGMLSWSTYYGGSELDYLNAAVCDASGDLYIAGTTTSYNGVATSGSFQTIQDAFVAKITSAGVRQWGRYIGGLKADYITGICVGGISDVYVAGYTSSSSAIATAGSHQAAKADTTDAFLMKITSLGAISWGTYYGGIGDDYGNAVSCDSAGNIYLCGTTGSRNNISTTGSYQPGYGGGLSDAFLAKFNPSGARIWGTYYGGAVMKAFSLMRPAWFVNGLSIMRGTRFG